MTIPLAADEKAVKALLTRLIQGALDEQEALARRALLQGGAHFNREFLARLRHDLRELAEERGIGIALGKYGDKLAEAFAAGVDAVPGAVFGKLDPRLLDLALANSEVLVQDILDEGVKLINAEMAKVVVGGKSLDKVADAIQEGLDLDSDKGITRDHAELIAGSEIKSVYRQGALAAGDEMGFEYYDYVGPDDDRTEPECVEYLQLGPMTLEQWQERVEGDGLDFDTFKTYGAHHGCRHSLQPVPAPDDAGTQRNAPADADA